MIALAQPYFKSDLGLAMDIKIEVVSGPSYYNRIISGDICGALKFLEDQGGRGDDHPTAWFIAYERNPKNTVGCGHIPAICGGSTVGQSSIFILLYQTL